MPDETLPTEAEVQATEAVELAPPATEGETAAPDEWTIGLRDFIHGFTAESAPLKHWTHLS